LSRKNIFILSAVVLGILILAFYIYNGGGTGFSPSSVGGPSASKILQQAKVLEDKGNLAGAKSGYLKLISEYPGSNKVALWQKKLEEINLKLIFSPALMPGSINYEIRPGDSLAKIAREHKTTVELIKRANNISDSRITPGRKIKVWNTPFTILVDKSQNTLILKAGEEVIKTYVVSTGKDNCTPVGTFKIVNKQVDPSWFKPGAAKPIPSGNPENVLGTRWMGFDLAGYGIHGTTEPQGLGKQVTQGCIRLANADVEELYTIVPIGTEVTVVD